MKNIIFTGVSVMALAVAAPAFAQSSSTVTQDGDGNEAEVTQVGPNTSEITQIGDLNVATVLQTDGPNESTILQTATGSNEAVVIQTAGSIGSISDITQNGTSDGNLAEVNNFSAGPVTTAEIFQTDSINGFVRIEQGSTGDTAAVVVQGDTSSIGGAVSGASDGTSVVSQAGNNVFALNVQAGNFQGSDILQNEFNDNNSALVFQGAFSGELSYSYVQQIGFNGVAEVSQNSVGNDSFIAQLSGDGNQAFVDQGSFAGGDANDASITQDGNGNSSTIEQNALTAGSLNNAISEQIGDDSTSTIFQEGSTNFAEVYQYDGSTSSVSQAGTGNSVTVTQGTP